MSFSAPSLPFAPEACEPVISAFTINNHLKHHMGYHTNLTSLLSGQACATVPLLTLLRETERIPSEIRQKVINNGGGYYNHCLYWENLSPVGAPSTELQAAIDASFGNMDGFRKAVQEKGMSGFGSYWVWLIQTEDGLQLEITANQNVPQKGKILMALDGWEHAWASDKTGCTGKGGYWSTVLDIVNWETVNRRFSE